MKLSEALKLSKESINAEFESEVDLNLRLMILQSKIDEKYTEELALSIFFAMILDKK